MGGLLQTGEHIREVSNVGYRFGLGENTKRDEEGGNPDEHRWGTRGDVS